MIGYLGADVSHHDGLSVTAARLECMKGEGLRFLIPGTQDDTIFVRQMRMGLDAGLRVEAYLYLYAEGRHPANPSVTPVEQVEWTIRKLRENGLLDDVKRLWLDVEDGFELGGVAANVQRLHSVIAACKREAPGLELGIYTRRFYWIDEMGNTSAFNSLPLWDAFFDNRPSFDYFVSYGGWAVPHTKQYMNTNRWCGVNNDRNYREVVEDAPAGPDYESIVKRLWPEYLGLAFEQGWVNEVLKDRTTALAQRVLAIDELFHEAGLR